MKQKLDQKQNFSTLTKTEARRQWTTTFKVLRENIKIDISYHSSKHFQTNKIVYYS